MHNCKSAKSSFIDLALDEIPPATSRQLLAELSACTACREEYAAIRRTLHVSGGALRSTTPGENFWPGYHRRLRQSLRASPALQSEALLDQSSSPVHAAEISNRSGIWAVLSSLLTTSVRIPVPAAAALMVLFVISLVVLRSHGEVNAIPTNQFVAAETKTVSVPVVQEKVITRVVYVERKNNRAVRERLDREQSGREQLAGAAFSNSADNLARSAATGSGKTALNLAGFEPTNQVRLTVIKGSYRDEK
jgi:hypothetical protein